MAESITRTVLSRLLNVQVLAAVATLLALMIAYAQWSASKSIEVRLLSQTPLLHHSATGSRVRVMFGDEAVAHPVQSVFRIANTGDLPILANEIESPLTLIYSNSKVLSASIRRASPTDLSPTVEAQATE